MLRMLALLLLSLASAPGADYDLIIRNARVLDGAGNPWMRADVAVAAGRIAAIGQLGSATANQTVDAKGLTLAPGFIDIHSHGRGGVFSVPSAENYIRQGVTTILEGPDGSSPLPLKPYLDKLSSSRIAVNIGFLAGHGTIRAQVMRSENRHSTPAEIVKMKDLMRQAMLDGAFGLSTGLFYVPGNYAATEEVVEIAKVAGSMGGIHISHMRDEASGILDRKSVV